MLVGRSWPRACMCCHVHSVRINVTRFWKQQQLQPPPPAHFSPSSGTTTLHGFLVFYPRSFQPFLSNELDPISLLQLAIIYCFVSPSVLWPFFGSIPMGFQSVTWTSFRSSILLTWPHHSVFCTFIYLTISCPFIKFCNSLLLLILHPPLHRICPKSFLKYVFQKQINYLRLVQTLSRFHIHRSLPGLSMSCISSF